MNDKKLSNIKMNKRYEKVFKKKNMNLKTFKTSLNFINQSETEDMTFPL